MTGSARRRDPDPARPGTVYRSKPRWRRLLERSGGSPSLSSERPGSQRTGRGSQASGGSAGPGLSSVDELYARHGGDADPGSEYGRQYDSRRDPLAREDAPPARPARPAPGTTAPPRRRRPPLKLITALVVLLLIGYPFLLGMTAWTHLNRVDALAPAHQALDTPDSPGRTYLVVGSDSRADLTAAERKRLGTGRDVGARTDTIMLLHVPAGGGPTALISLPRDSYVPIPGHSRNKINAAYAFGGPSLLIQTVESATGIRIDDYVETGLGGFATIVDALGGVTLCPKFDMKDDFAHINLKRGCQLMDGKTALGYARARHSDPRGDLGRVERQRETLAAISKKTLSPSTLIQPWRAFPAAKAGGGALTVDEGTSAIGLAKFVLAMRAVSGGGGVSLTVPISNPDLQTSNAGSAVAWDRTQALRLFGAIKANNMATVEAIAAAQKKTS